MSKNEKLMKDRGEARIWNTIKTRQGGLKKIASTQIGQQLIFTEALRVLPLVRDWIDNTSARCYRAQLKEYFKDDQVLLEKITLTLVLLSGEIHGGLAVKRNHLGKVGARYTTRHKQINTLKARVTPELSFDQTWRYLEVLIEVSKYFNVDSSMHLVEGRPYRFVKYTSSLGEEILESLTKEAFMAFYPTPMTEQPTDWHVVNNQAVGGYLTFQYDLIRFKGREINYSKYSDRIFNAVNYIQRVPWKVNKNMVTQVREDLIEPKKENYIFIKYPDDTMSRWSLDLEAEETDLTKLERESIIAARAVFREQAELYNAEAGDYESALGKYRATKMAVGIAELYLDEDRIYFPHSYDFRGRVYPIPVGLSPQGSDAVKSMLEYRDGEILTEKGIEWMWAYLASLFGDDKISFKERVARGKELLHKDYKEADEPYQFLSHQQEINKWLEDPSYEFKGRVHLDACNSGSQFTSAITGDKAGCIATNVIPTVLEDGLQERKDAYLLVADKATELTKSLLKASTTLEDKHTYEFLLNLLKESGRKICKTPVMVSNYGGTAGGRSEILWNMFRELGCERKWITKKNASLFSKIIGESIHGVLNGGKAFEGYIHKMNNILAKNNKPITWTTSDGFYVIHIKQKELKQKQVACMLPGSRRVTTITKRVFSDKISPAKMKSAISPNYIHSLDAELLRRVALKLQKKGVLDTAWIHDSFGCHPNHVNLMLEVTKKEFLKMMKKNPLKILDEQLREQAGIKAPIRRALKEINRPKLKGFEIREGGLDDVMKSNWFFS